MIVMYSFFTDKGIGEFILNKVKSKFFLKG